jgi:PAS domain S-box-containing protein
MIPDLRPSIGDTERIQDAVLKFRAVAYAVVAVISALLVVTGVTATATEMALIAVVGLIPMAAFQRAVYRLEAVLMLDCLVALLVWIIYGPIVGVDFMLLVIVAAGAFLLATQAAIRVTAAAVVSELAQIPLWALGVGVLDFAGVTDPTQAFLTGVLFRVVFILVAGFLFLSLARLLDKSRNTIQRREEQFRTAFHDSGVGMVMYSLEGQILEVNRTMCEMVGLREERLLERRWQDLMHPEDVEPMPEMERLLDGEIRSYQVEKRLRRADGSLMSALVNVSLVHDDGRAERLLAQIQDITARVEAHEKLQSLIRSKDEFVAAVSHELRTPLTAVLGMAHELHEFWDQLGNEERFELVSIIAEQSVEVSNIVEDLLVIARADIGTISINPAVLDLHDQVTTVMSVLPDALTSKVTIEGVGDHAFADPVRTRQIMRNLLTNAHRYGGPRVFVRLGSSERAAWVQVCDNGDGVPEEMREAIFEPYERAHQFRGQPGSVGLGLTVARQLARLMGGDLTYWYDHGLSFFELRLPLAPVDPLAPNPYRLGTGASRVG